MKLNNNSNNKIDENQKEFSTNFQTGINNTLNSNSINNLVEECYPEIRNQTESKMPKSANENNRINQVNYIKPFNLVNKLSSNEDVESQNVFESQVVPLIEKTCIPIIQALIKQETIMKQNNYETKMNEKFNQLIQNQNSQINSTVKEIILKENLHLNQIKEFQIINEKTIPENYSNVETIESSKNSMETFKFGNINDFEIILNQTLIKVLNTEGHPLKKIFEDLITQDLKSIEQKMYNNNKKDLSTLENKLNKKIQIQMTRIDSLSSGFQENLEIIQTMKIMQEDLVKEVDRKQTELIEKSLTPFKEDIYKILHFLPVEAEKFKEDFNSLKFKYEKYENKNVFIDKKIEINKSDEIESMKIFNSEIEGRKRENHENKIFMNCRICKRT